MFRLFFRNVLRLTYNNLNQQALKVEQNEIYVELNKPVLFLFYQNVKQFFQTAVTPKSF